MRIRDLKETPGRRASGAGGEGGVWWNTLSSASHNTAMRLYICNGIEEKPQRGAKSETSKTLDTRKGGARDRKQDRGLIIICIHPNTQNHTFTHA